MAGKKIGKTNVTSNAGKHGQLGAAFNTGLKPTGQSPVAKAAKK